MHFSFHTTEFESPPHVGVEDAADWAYLAGVLMKVLSPLLHFMVRLGSSHLVLINAPLCC